ncbi:hydroxymethylglutaryl-CoA synthase [Halovenus aranensis]|jgi:hydroxymethylglutaryl-CoA synthase|uniref:Hydroxymethylglutaryl-CoA synthase n=1 Tax=Halovenus aranensis TaxID=890420 RepID=A0A1G8XJJ7_9EURY|nr:hydroxymethylglutaryl-CoA synthase [Halovenus aranensis]SDJ90741.1 hydroxymethylglutaryl-CoA synthase [Halovenus aranensis]
MAEVGIDGIEIRTGKLKLDLPGTFAPAQGDDPEKFTKGLGLYTSSLPDVYEDIVTMAANASHRLLDRKDLSLSDIGRIDVATESAFDKSKPVSTYVAGCLEQVFEDDLHHANKGERKFACVAGTQALDDAYNWIRAGRNQGRKALVIATDTALYERDDPGESTQGAGAVAMLIDENPDLVAFSDAQGYGSADETDFLKPNQQFPSVDGKRSMQVYLARMREAMEDFERNGGDTHPDNFALIPFHTPFPGMVRRAAALGFRHCIRGTEVEEEVADEIGHQPRETEFDSHDAFLEAQKEYTETLTETNMYEEWYAETIEPTLAISRYVGNWYTGSVHIARAAGLQEALEDGRDLTGRQLLVGSYGSGAQAEIHAEAIQPGWEDEISQLNIDEQVENRRDITFDEYEQIHDVHNHDESIEMDPLTTPDGEFVFDGWGRMGERKYSYVE